MNAARCVFEVTAGVIPGTPEPEHTRRWAITSEQWEDEARRDEVWLETQGKAMVYALSLQNPRALNWVRLDWIYL